MKYMYPQYPPKKKHGNFMSLEGTGGVKVNPDIAAVTIGITTEDLSLEKAQQENAVKAAAVVGTLRKLGIAESDIQTQSYSVDPQYDYPDGKQVFTGYKVTHLYRVIIRDIAKTGAVIDGAVKNGANVVGNIDFTLSDPAVYYRKALKLAVRDAVSKAEELERTLDVQVNKTPVSITEESRGDVSPAPVMMLKAEAATPVQPGMLEVTARIKAVFEYDE